MIKDVMLRELKVLRDERGFLFEILRADWENFKKFGQVYITCCFRGWVKGWHYHKIQWDNFCCVKGETKVVLVDMRENSETHMEVNEFVLSSDTPSLLTIPPLVLHGFECLSEDECWILNIPSEVYNYLTPDEFRIPLDDPKIPYEPWRDKRGY